MTNDYYHIQYNLYISIRATVAAKLLSFIFNVVNVPAFTEDAIYLTCVASRFPWDFVRFSLLTARKLRRECSNSGKGKKPHGNACYAGSQYTITILSRNGALFKQVGILCLRSVCFLHFSPVNFHIRSCV